VASNDRWLTSLALSTGGRVFESVDASKARMFDREGLKPVSSRSPLWPWLLAWIPVVFLIDVAARRIAWDRWLDRAEIPTQPAAAAAFERVAKLVETAAAPPPLAYQGAQLSTDDAAKLAEAARDRRRAERLRAAKEETFTPVTGSAPAAEKKEEEAGSSLLAAKRRARERFDDDTSRSGA
jgi:hypothetical protein